ncbi:MAG: hypothetical protein GY852_06050 [bacterium]|nr:hypothetical protein [bacterium]
MDDFTATHKQCQHCGSYFPADEAQYFEGMLICPSCHGALQEEEREKEEKMEKAARESETSEEMSTTVGECERCGRPTDVFYMLGGRKLCKICYDASSQDFLSRGPGGSATLIKVTKVENEEKGIFQKILDAITGKEEETYERAEIEEAPREEPQQESKPKKKSEDEA